MTTLFQLYANIDTLKTKTVEMSRLWHTGDQIVLLGATVTLYDWLQAYISEINEGKKDGGDSYAINEITDIFVLTEDIEKLNQSAKVNLNFSTFKDAKITVLSDSEWVGVTQAADRIITLR